MTNGKCLDSRGGGGVATYDAAYERWRRLVSHTVCKASRHVCANAMRS